MAQFLDQIGHHNQALIRHIMVEIPYRPTLALRRQHLGFAKVLKHIHTLDIQFEWRKVRPSRFDMKLVDYEPFLNALAAILKEGKRGSAYRQPKRVIQVPPPPGSRTPDPLYRVRLVSKRYLLLPGVSICQSSCIS
jgi:hypothetical protein